MQEKLAYGEIVSGHEAWIRETARAASKRIEFGMWWRLGATYWCVAWIEATCELYAVERQPSDRFVVLCRLGKKEVNDLMRKWFDGDDLYTLLRRLGLALE